MKYEVIKILENMDSKNFTIQLTDVKKASDTAKTLSEQ